MKNTLLFFLLILFLTSCQHEQEFNQDPFLTRVIESPEFKALVDARISSRENKLEKLVAQREEFKEGLAGLNKEEKEARWAERNKVRDDEHKERMKWAEKLRQRNDRIMSSMQEHPNWTKEELDKAIAQIDLEMGIIPEMLTASTPGKLNAAMQDLMRKFPEIAAAEFGSAFLEKCFDAYEKKIPS